MTPRNLLKGLIGCIVIANVLSHNHNSFIGQHQHFWKMELPHVAISKFVVSQFHFCWLVSTLFLDKNIKLSIPRMYRMQLKL